LLFSQRVAVEVERRCEFAAFRRTGSAAEESAERPAESPPAEACVAAPVAHCFAMNPATAIARIGSILFRNSG
jgi:hypothetical protein